MTIHIESKFLGGKVIETKEDTIAGQRVGVIQGYIATWDVDEGGMFGMPDQFERGAFLESLQEHRDRDNRQIRLKDMHQRVVGGFPIDMVTEDETGLRAVGHINLQTQQGAEAWALIKQGVLTDLSIGFTALEDSAIDGVRHITKAIIWEGSIIDEPANRNARILSFKNASTFQDLPLASQGRPWNRAEASARVAEWATSAGDSDEGFRKAHVLGDSAEGPRFLIADVDEDRLVAVPAAIQSVAQMILTTETDFEGKAGVIRHLERYFAKMGSTSPFPEGIHEFIGVDEAKSMDVETLESSLRRGVAFSKGAARLLCAKLRPKVKVAVSVSEPGFTEEESKGIEHTLELLREIVKPG